MSSSALHKDNETDSSQQEKQLQGQVQGKLTGSEKWSKGLQLPQKLSIGTLAKHAGVDRAFMQVCNTVLLLLILWL